MENTLTRNVRRSVRLRPEEVELTRRAAEIDGERWGTWAREALIRVAQVRIARSSNGRERE